MTSIAVITGATGGLGQEFVRLAVKEELDEIWAVARNPEKLAALKETFGGKIRPVACDLTKTGDIQALSRLLEEEKPVKFPGLVSPRRVAEQAMRDSAKGKDMSVCSLYVKYEHLMSKLLPQKTIMKIWMKGIRDYV